MRYGMPFMNARHVINAVYVYVVGVVYAASCCSHGPCYNEPTRCRNIKYSSLIRYPSVFNTSAFRSSWNNHIINMLPWQSFQLRVRKPITNVNFQAVSLKFPSQNTKNWRHLSDGIRLIHVWHMAYSGLMNNGVCQLFLIFAFWVTEFWIRWPD